MRKAVQWDEKGAVVGSVCPGPSGFLGHGTLSTSSLWILPLMPSCLPRFLGTGATNYFLKGPWEWVLYLLGAHSPGPLSPRPDRHVQAAGNGEELEPLLSTWQSDPSQTRLCGMLPCNRKGRRIQAIAWMPLKNMQSGREQMQMSIHCISPCM